jgi:membrane protein
MTQAQDPYGRNASGPHLIPLAGWRQVFSRVVTETMRDNVSLVAAGCAFYALFAIFPGISALVSLYGLLTDPLTVEQQLAIFAQVLPDTAYDMLIDQTRQLTTSSGRTLGYSFALSLGLAAWSMMMSTQALFAAMNIAYEQPEMRSIPRYYASTMLFALFGGATAAIVLSTLVYAPVAFQIFGQNADWLDETLRLVRWPILAVLVWGGLSALYRYAPCRMPAKWRWVAVGAAIATLLWLGVSILFSIYVDNFANYDRTYGSLGAVIVLLFWLYLTFFIILLGAEINAELELQTSVDTTVGDEKAIGARGAFVADHVAGGPGGDKRPLSPVARDPAIAKRRFGAALKPSSEHVRLAGIAAAIGSVAYLFGRWRR